MGKVIFSILVTLDGFIDHTAMIADEELHEFSARSLDRVRAVLFGRRTYQLFEEYWPVADADASATPAMLQYAQRINEIDKIVFSRTLDRLGWNPARLVKTVDPSEINRLKQDGDLVIAGSKLAHSFMKLDLIDEYQLLVNPILLGHGVPLFKEGIQRVDLELSDMQKFGSGVVVLTYQRPHGS
jgi:dihydrofolate reductase